MLKRFAWNYDRMYALPDSIVIIEDIALFKKRVFGKPFTADVGLGLSGASFFILGANGMPSGVQLARLVFCTDTLEACHPPTRCPRRAIYPQ